MQSGIFQNGSGIILIIILQQFRAPLIQEQVWNIPGLTVIGLANDPYPLDEVIAHEICHNWFYSAIGSDERRFPFYG